MEWFEIVKIMAEFGFMTVAAAIVIWQIVQHSKNNQNKEGMIDKNYEDMINDVKEKQNKFYEMLLENQKKNDERYQKMIDKVLELIQKPHLLSEKENDRMTKIDGEIDQFLAGALENTNSSRVSLIKYHNGGNDMLGNSILKMSMSNEKCAAGVIHILHNCQNQLRTFSTYLMNELNEKKYCFIEDVENLKDVDNSLYQFMKQLGIKAKFMKAITDIKNGVVIGYISIDYANNEHIDLDKVQHSLEDNRMKIEALLNL